MKKTGKQVRKEIWGSLSIEDKLHETMLQKVRQLIIKGRGYQTAVVGSASKILFPKKGEVALQSIIFDALWEKKQHKKALQAYRKGKKPFWHAEAVGQYYEKQGLIKQAIVEYEYLMNAYSKMGRDFLPLPAGPVALFKLGKWYAKRNSRKAKKYLTLYLKAEKDKHGTGLGIRHKNAAKAILEGI